MIDLEREDIILFSAGKVSNNESREILTFRLFDLLIVPRISRGQFRDQKGRIHVKISREHSMEINKITSFVLVSYFVIAPLNRSQ